MTTQLDMSLDDIIKAKKTTTGPKAAAGSKGVRNQRGSAHGVRTGGPIRKPNTNRNAMRAVPYGVVKAPMMAGAWQHDLFDVGTAAAAVPGVAGGVDAGAKLYISNLDFGVSQDDVKELFSEVGVLKKYAMHYDRSGRSKGTAEVVFARKSDAVAAMTKYNNVQLDGKPMKIELIGITAAGGALSRLGPMMRRPMGMVMPPQMMAMAYAQQHQVQGVRNRANNNRTRVGGANKNRGGGQGGGKPRTAKENKTPKTQEELDKELDAWKTQKAEPMAE